MKAFSVKDGYALSNILTKHGIEPIILTCRASEIVLHKCEELGIKKVIQGASDKKNALLEIMQDRDLSCCKYFGDDIPDLECIKAIIHAGGTTGCPADTVSKVKSAVNYVCKCKSGDGALREFAEYLVNMSNIENDKSEKVAEAVKYIKSLDTDSLNPGKYVDDNDFYFMVQEYPTKPESE